MADEGENRSVTTSESITWDSSIFNGASLNYLNLNTTTNYMDLTPDDTYVTLGWNTYSHNTDESDFGSMIKKSLESLEPSKKTLKAQQFLKSWLTDDEYKDLQNDGLIIQSKLDPNKTYKVKKGASMMVEVYYKGKLDHKLCAIDQGGRYENDDTVLSKILMLKANEKKFLKTAERHELHIAGWLEPAANQVWVTTGDHLTITWDLSGDVCIS